VKEDMIVENTVDKRIEYCPCCGREHEEIIERTRQQRMDFLDRLPVAKKRKPEDKTSIRKLKRAS
jgi:predicted Fe-S protein YdhL (DUF1289 family)